VTFRAALILDPHYGNKLKNLCVDLPVWVVNSPENDLIINALRANCSCQDIQITTFPLKEGESRSHACERIIESLDQHYNEYAMDGGYLELEVIGVTLDEVSMLPFFEVGFTKFSQTDTGFIAYKIQVL
jgi:hypothetical protein